MQPEFEMELTMTDYENPSNKDSSLVEQRSR
jgi:hypothetical protein